MPSEIIETIEWDLPKLQKFQSACRKAIRGGMSLNDAIVFDGHEFNLKYAQYLIEYLESQLTD